MHVTVNVTIVLLYLLVMLYVHTSVCSTYHHCCHGYHVFPLAPGLAELSSLQEAVIQHPYLFGAKQRPPSGRKLTRKKSVSTECVITVEEEGGAPIIPSQSDGE